MVGMGPDGGQGRARAIAQPREAPKLNDKHENECGFSSFGHHCTVLAACDASLDLSYPGFDGDFDLATSTKAGSEHARSFAKAGVRWASRVRLHVGA